jgi:hypothetical protein
VNHRRSYSDGGLEGCATVSRVPVRRKLECRWFRRLRDGDTQALDTTIIVVQGFSLEFGNVYANDIF